MRFILCLLATTTLSMPAFAQDGVPVAADDTISAPAADARVTLAAKMHEIWPVRTRVEEAINLIGEDVPDTEREAFKARMRQAIDQTKLEEESIAAMARTFSETELQAMVNFYGSPEGRSISVKTEDYMKQLEPIMVKMLDSALLKLRTGAPLQSTPAAPPSVTP